MAPPAQSRIATFAATPHMIRRLLFALLIAGAMAAPGDASAELNGDDRAHLARVVAYLNAARSMSADFIQIGPNGELSKGRMFLSRPGRLRFEYAPPSPLLLVADGFWLTLLDKELEQAHRWPVSDTPLGILVADRIAIGDRATATAVERRGGVLRVTFVDSERPDEGNLTLVFSEPPLLLRNWEVLDAQGGVTNVSLQNIRTNVVLKPELFTYEEPKPFSGDGSTR